MSTLTLELDTHPTNAANLLLEGNFATVVWDERLDLGEGKEVIVIVLEKYYMRNRSRASMTVIFENSWKVTIARIITSGSANTRVCNFDWGISDSFLEYARESLSDFIVKEYPIPR